MCAGSTDLVSTGATLESPQRTLERHYAHGCCVLFKECLFLFYVCVFCLHCTCMHHMSPPQMPEEGVRAPGSEVEEGGCQEASLGPL